MAVNWLLGVQQQNAGESFANAFRQGQKDNQAKAAKDALSTLVRSPNDTTALGNLARLDPEKAMEFRKQQAEILKAHVGDHQDNIIKGAQILRQFNPKDQQSYSQALAAAQAAGIDISQVPQQFNQQYVDGVIKVADALKAEPNPQLVPFVPGGGVAQRNPQTGQLENLVISNPGGYAAGTPAVPQVHDQASYDAVPPGGQYMGPDGHMRVKQGGQTQPASGGFR